MTYARRVSHYPRKSLRPQEAAGKVVVVRRIDVRPGRFLVRNPRTGAFDWQTPAEFVTDGDVVAPLQAALYVARVEDLGSDGDCLVRVWEVPNGLAGTTTLTAEQLGELRPNVGDTLRIYTWIEVSRTSGDGFGPPRPRVRVEVAPRPEPSAAQRAMLQTALDRLAQGEDP